MDKKKTTVQLGWEKKGIASDVRSEGASRVVLSVTFHSYYMNYSDDKACDVQVAYSCMQRAF